MMYINLEEKVPIETKVDSYNIVWKDTNVEKRLD
jgi:hypothetical protein